jgi:hypothetical protein
MFRLSSEFSVMFRLCSEYLAQKLVCSESLDFVVKAPTKKYEVIFYSNMTFFIGYINNTVKKLQIYFNSHMHVKEN